jgi:hypothetical protein
VNAPSLVVLVSWAVALGWFCLVGAWAGSLARPTVGVLGAIRVSMWLGFALVTAFVLAAGLVWPLRSTAVTVTALVLTVAAIGAWVLVRRRRGSVPPSGPILTGSWWVIVPLLALLVVAYIAAHAVFGPVTNYDTGLYHLNAIQYAQDYPTIHGLANLHTRLGTNVSAFNLAAFGSNTPWGDDAFRLVAGIFVTALLADLSLRMIDGRAGTWRRPGTYVLVLVLIAAVPGLLHAPGYRIASPSPDTTAMVATVVAGAYLVDALVTRQRAWAAVALTTAALAASIRTQLWVAFAATVAVLVLAWLLGRRRSAEAPAGSRALLVAAAVVSVVLGLLMAVRDLILSGWLLFPVTYFPMPVDWRVPTAATQSTRDWIMSWARDTTAGPEKTLTSWYWVGSWVGRTIADWWVAAGLGLLVVAVVAWVVAVVLGRRAPHADPAAGPEPSAEPTDGLGGWPVLVLALVPTVAGLASWFLTAPDPRFAWGSLLLVGAIPAGLALARLQALREDGSRPGAVGILVTAVLALVAVPYGVSQARAAVDVESPPGTVTDVRTYAFGPLTVWASVTPLPRPPIDPYTLSDGNQVGLTQGGDQCWAFVPCMPYANDALVFRGGSLADGFTTR